MPDVPWDSDKLNDFDKVDAVNKIVAHKDWHNRFIVDCRPGICPFVDRRNSVERRRLKKLWGILRMCWYALRHPERRTWTDRRTSYGRTSKY